MTARYCGSKTDARRPPYRGRAIGWSTTPARLLKSSRFPTAAAGCSVDKKQAGRELNRSADSGGAEDGDLVSVSRAFARLACSGKVKNGWDRWRRKSGQPDRDHSHESAAFAVGVARGREANPRPRCEDWREVPLVTIVRPTLRTMTTRFMPSRSRSGNKGGYIVHVAIADVAFACGCSALDRDAPTRAIRCISGSRGADAA